MRRGAFGAGQRVKDGGHSKAMAERQVDKAQGIRRELRDVARACKV